MYTDVRVWDIGEFSGKFLLHFFLRQRDNASVMLQYSSTCTILTKMMCVNLNFYLRNYSW